MQIFSYIAGNGNASFTKNASIEKLTASISIAFVRKKWSDQCFMARQQLINNHDLIIQRCHQGVKLLRHEQVNNFKNSIPLNDMLNMPFHVFFNNGESELQLYNEAGLKTFNLPSASDAIGLTTRDLGKKRSAELCIHHDKIVLDLNKMIIKDELFTALDGRKLPWLTYKFPWYNSDNKIIGVFGLSVNVDKNEGLPLAHCMTLMMQTGLLQHETEPSNHLPGLTYGDMYFTRSEKKIISLLIRGKTARKIASTLSRSQRTIEHHIENMKHKTNSDSKSELIEKIVNDLFK